MSAPMLIHNRHSAACGIPPALSTEAADLYIGYFENRYGEQFVFTFDKIRGYRGEKARELGLIVGAQVRFNATADHQVISVELVKP